METAMEMLLEGYPSKSGIANDAYWELWGNARGERIEAGTGAGERAYVAYELNLQRRESASQPHRFGARKSK